MKTLRQASTCAVRRTLAVVLAIALLTAPVLGVPAAVGTVASADDTLATSAWAWGGNSDGQIGDDSSGGSALPVPVRESSGTGQLGNIVAIAAGDGDCWDACDSRAGHSLALDREGYVWEWGDAPNDPGTTPRPFPVPVVRSDGTRLGGIVAIAAGGNFSLALDRDTHIWQWGSIPGSGAHSPWPQPVPGAPGDGRLQDIVAIAAGAHHALALDREGRVWAWGSNSDGQLGDGTTASRRVPAPPRDSMGAAPLGEIAAVAASAVHSLALDRTGRLWAWGMDDEGGLGRGTRHTYLLPGLVLDPAGTAPLDRITAIAAGGRQSLALDADGHVWQFRPRANRVVDAAGSGVLGDIVAISMGYRYALAMDRAGQVWDLRRGYPAGTPPILVPNPAGTGPLRDMAAVTAGKYHALALGRDGRVWAWGNNGVGQLGATPPPFYPGPILVRSSGDVALDAPVVIAASYRRSLALDREGRVWAWGNGSHEGWFGGERRPGLVLRRDTAAPLNGMVAVAGGAAHGLALDADGAAWAWGDDAAGQLGDGPGSPDLCSGWDQWPCSVGAVPVAGLPPIAAIAAGGAHALALDRGGRVWAWGSNDTGALGTGDTKQRESPVRVPGLASIVAVAAGSAHSLALGADGTVWAWGNDTSGQVGDGPGSGQCGTGQQQYPCLTSPVRLEAPTGVVAIAAGEAHSLALLAGGGVWAWGLDDDGQLGDGPGAPDTCTRYQQPVACATSPVAVAGLSEVAALAAGGGHSLALTGDGQARAWGANTFGQLGDGTVAARDAPVPVLDRAGAPLAGVVALAAGTSHSLALRATDPAAERCFPQSGYCLRGSFLAYWREHGGLALNGYPLGDPFYEILDDGRAHRVQYFERVRLEQHLENAPPHDILLGQFGRRILAGIPGAPVAPVAAREGDAHFASTGHNVRPDFFAFWDAHGGLAQFGPPLSEEFTEVLEDGNAYTVQYFERARFEWHPGHAGTPYEVQLGQLGRRALAER